MKPIFTVTFCTQDMDTGANPLWHTCLLLSRYDEETKQMEVVDTWGFYGLPQTDKSKSLTNTIKGMLALNTDMYNNFGWMRPEDVRYLDMGRGLHGVTFQVKEEMFNELTLRNQTKAKLQKECVDEFAEAFKLKPKGCEVLRMSTPPSLTTLDAVPIKCNTGFIRCGDQLFYINKNETNKCCNEIKLEKNGLDIFDAEFKPAEKSRILTKDEAELATEITGQKPHESFRIDPYEEWSAFIYEMELKLAKLQKREPRLDLFAFINLWPETCKTKALDQVNGIITKAQHERVSGMFRSVSRTSGPMETIHLYSVGPFRKFTKPNGDVVYSRNFGDKAKGTRLFWTVPPQEVEMFSPETAQLFKVYDAPRVKDVVRKLEYCESFFINSGLDKKYPSLLSELTNKIRERFKVFATIREKEAAPALDPWSNLLFKVLDVTADKHERLERKNIQAAKNMLSSLYFSMADQWTLDVEGEPDAEALAAYLSADQQRQLYSILGRWPVKHEQEVKHEQAEKPRLSA